MVVAEPLYGFYNTEINLHFLHALVGRSYGRVIMYCSNFERTTADALFFESLLCLARLVVAAAVAESTLSPEDACGSTPPP
ncbi:hypothetical protein Esi_0181_0020 [Ectocarpus siliculosus]|uniref:Uncharacterized protein n=1 Tax=Ectocarpus siliculosus TaxID=2880 RepID=D8LGU1_ECTSI|nr:hypothetical protein Esi_0181_0020 [Ectocarpus siliculosus]|eukprot:CBN75794.1 hypothetical protein Esi_0181_0020 [Ectocarpus siliculosus]